LFYSVVCCSLLSFPTRRSSDLRAVVLCEGIGGQGMADVRRGAQLLQGSVWRDSCRSPASGRSFGVESGTAGWPLFAAGRDSYERYMRVLCFCVGAPPRGEALG